MQNEICFKIEGLTKRYSKSDEKPVLDIDRLEIMKGEVTAIIGYSAAGKSTLLNILGLLDTLKGFDQKNATSTLEYHHGDMVYDYEKISRKKKKWLLRHHFGFIFQNHHLTSHLTARNNILLPMALKNIHPGRQEDVLAEFAKEADMDAKSLKSLPYSLSGGLSLRVSVLRALAHSPRVLFADEPTGSLDPTTGEKIMKLIKAWHDEGNGDRSTVLVTHNFHQAWEYADRFIIFKAGKPCFDQYKGRELKSRKTLFNQLN